MRLILSHPFRPCVSLSILVSIHLFLFLISLQNHLFIWIISFPTVFPRSQSPSLFLFIVSLTLFVSHPLYSHRQFLIIYHLAPSLFSILLRVHISKAFQYHFFFRRIYHPVRYEIISHRKRWIKFVLNLLSIGPQMGLFFLWMPLLLLLHWWFQYFDTYFNTNVPLQFNFPPLYVELNHV